MNRFRTLAASLLAIIVLAAACGDDTADIAVAGEEPSSNDSNDELPVNDDEPTDESLNAGPYPIADLTFEVDLGDGVTAVYRLACLGDTATFNGDTALFADEACLALNDLELRSRLLTDDHLDRMCTEQYGGPQTASVTGTLTDEPVDTTITRANGCGIADWDRALITLLPSAA